MTDGGSPSELVKRLHQLRISKGLTINQMADLCGVPKSSLESYMRMSGAKRPGVDALVSIADGMSVTLDWLVGRTDSVDSFHAEDYAVFCHSVVVQLLSSILLDAQENPETIDPVNLTIRGRDFHDLAARASLEFMEVVNRQKDHPNRPSDYFRKTFDTLKQWQPIVRNNAPKAGPTDD